MNKPFHNSLKSLRLALFLLLPGAVLLAQTSPSVETLFLNNWEAGFGGAGSDGQRAMQRTSDNGVILGGWSSGGASGNKTSEGHGDFDYWIVKVDARGIKEWERSFGGRDYDELQVVRPTADGGFVLGGHSFSEASGTKTSRNFGSRDFWIIKIDAQGVQQWEAGFGSAQDDILKALLETSDGGFLVGGWAGFGQSGNKTSDGYGERDFWVLKVDRDGDKVWERTLGGTGQDQLNALIGTGDGGFVAGGSSQSDKTGNKSVASRGGNDFWIVKLDQNGEALWQHGLGGEQDDVLYALALTDAGAVVAGGMSLSGATGNKTVVGFQSPDFWVMQFAPRTAATGTPVVYVDGRPIVTGPVVRPGPVEVQLQTSFPQGKLFYTLDGSKPTSSSLNYTERFMVNQSATLRAIAYTSNLGQSAEADPLLLQITQIFPLTTTVSGEGTIDASPNQSGYPANSTVRLDAKPAAGWSFSHWSGDIQSSNPEVTLFMDGAKSVTAHFARVWELNVAAAPGGRVNRIPDQDVFTDGTVVELQAMPEPHFTFAGWSGDASGTENPLRLTMSSSKKVSAQFVLTQLSIIVEGSGAVERTPNKSSYAIGEPVTLTARPAAGSAFRQWGDGSTNNPRVVAIGTNNIYKAIFSSASAASISILVNGQNPNAAVTNLNTAEITIHNLLETNGPIFHTIDGSAPVLNSARYTGPFVVKQSVAIRALAFSSDYSRAAEAGPVRVAVAPGFSLLVETSGGGSVVRSPFQSLYLSNSVVQLTATPASGWGFLRWSGAASSTNNPLSMVLDRDKSVTAHFGPLVEMRTVVTGGGSIIRNPDQSGYAAGTRVRLQAVADRDFVFIGWTGEIGPGSTNNPTEVLVETNKTVTAHFVERIRPVPIQLGTMPLPDFWVPDGAVRAMVQTNGLLYLAGEFKFLSPSSGGAVALDKASGQIQPGWPTVNGRLSAAISDGAGGWFLGGQFSFLGNLATSNLVHLRADRSVNSAFAPNPNGPVSDLVWTNNTLYVAGQFTRIGGQNRNFVAALRSDGQVTAWNPDPDRPVSVIVAAHNRLYAGGSFDFIGARVRSKIAALDLVSGLASDWNPSADSAVEAIQVAPDGTVYAGGIFRSIRGKPRSFIAAIHSETGEATEWNPGADQAVRTLALVGDVLYAGGEFESIGGEMRRGLAALNTDSGGATAWNPSRGSFTVVRKVIRDGQAIYVAGALSELGGQPRSGVAAVDAATGQATSWNPSVRGAVSALGVAGNTVFVGGEILTVNGVERHGLAALDVRTGAPTDWSPKVEGEVFALTIWSNTVYLGGFVTAVNGVSRNRLAAVAVDSGRITDWNPDPTGPLVSIDALAASESAVYVGGRFEAIGGRAQSCFAGLDPVSGRAMGPDWQVDSRVRTIVIAGPHIYFGGDFGSVQGMFRARIAALDQQTGALTQWNPIAYDPVWAIQVAGNTVYVAGKFTTIGGKQRFHLAALDRLTGRANDWSPIPENQVFRLGWSGSTLFVGGLFNNISGQPRQGAAALDGITGTPLDWDIRLQNAGPAPTIFLAAEDRLYVAGQFPSVAGQARPNLAVFELSHRLDPGRLKAGGWTQNGFKIDLDGSPEQLYIIQASTNLIDWSPVITNRSPFSVADPIRLPYRFYRAHPTPR